MADLNQAYGKIGGFLVNCGEWSLIPGTKTYFKRPLVVRGGEYVTHLGSNNHFNSDNIVSALKRIHDEKYACECVEKLEFIFKPEELYYFDDLVKSDNYEMRKALARYTKKYHKLQVEDKNWRVRLAVAVNNIDMHSFLKEDDDYRIISYIASVDNKFHEEFMYMIMTRLDEKDVVQSQRHQWVRLAIARYSNKYHKVLKEKFPWDRELKTIIDNL